MKIERVQHWLAQLAARGTAATDLEREAGDIVTWLFGVDGAVALADTAAWSTVRDECYSEERDGHRWWSTSPSELCLMLSDDDQEAADQVAGALRYLSTRGVLQIHPQHSFLVRWPE